MGKNGLIDGVNAAHFEPDGSLTVAQAIKLAAALHQRIENGTVTLKTAARGIAAIWNMRSSTALLKRAISTTALRR